MAIPDEKYQNSPTGGQAFPDEGAKAPLCPPVAPRLKVWSVLPEKSQIVEKCHISQC